jgi:hypothetical protein
VKAEYDSTADALSIDIRTDVDSWDSTEAVDDDYCHVALTGGEAVNVELLSPAEHLELLARAADRFGLDAQELEAAARSALAAPDRRVTLQVGAPLGS